MKIYFVYDGEPDSSIVGERLQREAYKAKITIPDKWMAEPVSKLLDFFVKTYNTKFAAKQLAAADMHVKCSGMALPLSDTIGQHVQEYNDVYIMHNAASEADRNRPAGSILCTNYGCGKYFLPDDNTDCSCSHHAKGPVFHDTYKYWSCCPEQRAMDWEDFEKIPPCVTSAHSTANAPISFKQEAITATALSQEQRAALEAGGSTAAVYEGKPRTGPREFEGALHGAQQPQEVIDGKATCRNFGCQQPFVVADNHDEACSFHAEGPVFWDTYKYWKCCPHKKAAEFEEFVKIPGCSTGPHKL